MKTQEFIKHICSILEQQNLISVERARSIVTAHVGKSRIDFESFLIDEGLLDKRSLLQALATFYKVPAFDASGYFFDHYLVTRFPKDILTSEVFIPLEVEDDTFLWVIASQPDDPDLLEVIGRYVSWDVQFMVGLYQDIRDAAEEFYDEALTISDTSEYLADERSIAEKSMDRARRKINP